MPDLTQTASPTISQRMHRRFSHKWIGVVGLLSLLGAAGWIVADCTYRPTFLAGPMVQLLKPDGFTLAWRLDKPGDSSVEIIGPDGARTGNIVPDAAGHVTITGLSASADYTYTIHTRVLGRDVVLHRDTLRSAPAAGQPLRFLAFGDTGDGGADQERIAEQLLNYEPDLAIHTGDLIYNRGEAQDYYLKFYRPYAELISRVPFYPCLGNHDMRNSEDPKLQGRPFLDAFVLPDDGPAELTREREYWFDFGNARFIALDSNRDADMLRTKVAPWLDGVLASTADRWKIVYFHEPPYTHGGHDQADQMLNTIVPVLDKYSVQLVFSGHNHMYERTHPLRGGKPVADGEGTVYIVTGAGGAGLYKEKLPAPAYLATWYDQRHSFTVVDVDTEQMRIRQINDLGEMVDSAMISRQSP